MKRTWPIRILMAILASLLLWGTGGCKSGGDEDASKTSATAPNTPGGLSNQSKATTKPMIAPIDTSK